MNPTSILYFVLLLTLWHSQIRADNAPKSSDLITKTCDKTMYKDLCNEILRAGNATYEGDLYGLAITALLTAAENATSIYDHINDMLSGTLDASTEQILTDCSENYQDALDQLEDSITALESKGYNDINTWVSAAMADAESCEIGFKDKQQGNQSPLTQTNTLFGQICSIALTVTNHLAEA